MGLRVELRPHATVRCKHELLASSPATVSFLVAAMDDSGRIEELLRQKAAAEAAAADAKRRLRNARGQARKDGNKRQRQWTLSEELKRVALILFERAGYDASAAAVFLRGVAAKRKWEMRTEVDVRRLVDDLFMEVDLDHLALLCDVANPSDVVAMRTAVRFWEQWALAAWVKEVNQRQGVAPSTEMVLDRLERQRLDLPEAVRPAGKGDVAMAKARAWACKWRRRWGFRYGTIRTREDIPAQEMREKAP